MEQLQPRCKCGQVMKFDLGQTKSRCQTRGCGMRWELRPEGYWAIGLFTISLTPIFTDEKVCSVRPRKDRYSNYPKSSRKRKGRKAGSRC